MQDITSRVSDEEMNNARMSRERSTNPPDFEPGMGEGDDDDFFDTLDGLGGSSSSGGDMSGFGLNSGLGGMGMGAGGLGMMGQPQPVAPTESVEDKFFGALKKFFVGFKDWAKNFIKSFKSFDLRKKIETGKSIFISSLVVTALGFIFLFLLPNLGVQLMVGSLFAGAFGVCLFMISYDKAKEEGVDLSTPVQESPTSFGTMSNDDDDIFGGGIDLDADDSDDDMFGFDEADDDDTIDLSSISGFDDEPAESPTPKDATEVLSTVTIDKGMVTRQYLYETISQVLPSCDKSYDKEVVYSEDSREFNAWDAMIKQAADVFRTTQEDSPNLIELKDKLFYYQLTISRVKWIKNIEQLVTELVNIVKYDDNGGKDDNVYGTGVYIGQKALIKIYKGGTAMVSVADAYRQVRNEVLDTKNKMPVVLGIDSEGKVIVKDLTKIFALCVSGMPRSGKTWLVQSMLAQMMFYMKPSELIFYIYDPKDNLSDFKAMTMPHIKDFRSKDEDIVAGLRYIVKTEAERRTKIIGGAGFVNIEDYKRANPMAEMPYLYVVIDEVITFATRMKDERMDLYKEFQSYLKELVSRLPNMGIRLFMIPHVLKNDIIQKTTTDLIPCRISVKGSPDHIESVTGAKPKDFTYTLSHAGDMAIRLDGYTNFCHAAILSATNEGNNEIFNFLTQFWLKIEPESEKGSVYEKQKTQREMSDTLSGMHNDIIDSSGVSSGSILDEPVISAPNVSRKMDEMGSTVLGGMSTEVPTDFVERESNSGVTNWEDILEDDEW